MSIKRPIYLEPDKYSLLGFKMSPLTSFLCTFCVLLTLNGKLVDSEALPGRSIPSISDKTPHNLPSSMLSGWAIRVLYILLLGQKRGVRFLIVALRSKRINFNKTVFKIQLQDLVKIAGAFYMLQTRMPNINFLYLKIVNCMVLARNKAVKLQCSIHHF